MGDIMTDIEIARKSKKEKIIDVAKRMNLEEDDLILFGDSKAKIKKNIDDIRGELILVTAISPTPLGEEKQLLVLGLLML